MALTALGLSGPPVSAEQITAPHLSRLPQADIVLLGEIHDNAGHHANQALSLAALRPSAVVFEMLTSAQAEIVNRLGAGAEGLPDALGWANSGWPDWPLYAPVFGALGDADVYGMALPRATVRAAITEGAAAVFPGDAGRFGLDQSLDASEAAQRQADQQAAHCNALPDEMLPGMVEAQRLRDAAFAQITLVALQETGGPVAVITGNGHARTDHGMARALRQAEPGLRVLSVGHLESLPEGDPPYDLWLVTPPAPRDDPCAVFDRPAKDG
ncbi:ChaN family lipoprotein [Pseudoruegeria sp. SK021]|uniref:ChaN family lipoprotein n=1 Tax=Pseudoruegeria sp. SK021 TaxID=1933035 RepID=UPI001F0A7926|nr:ChaN family lipoprotein [Pseudoruegeria sp. SK021]